MLTPDATGSASAWQKFSARKFRKKFTTITISPGANPTAAKTTGSSAKAPRQPSPAKKVSSAEPWVKRPSSSKVSKTNPQNILSTAPFTAQAASWAAWRPKEKSTEKPEQSSAPAKSPRK